ncbi:hypothetical protein RDV89_09990 [Nocardioides zeae]|uniref:Lipoprotein n=1 Tax=Nocardioides imazamoxiresistens TaxID=3231893 RepID=A0ABU3PVZ1_9ACTN|nr:hypothetical protein [Nocardioides zeae]MDT9593398.1 hypothetical protein [Nocardioides zeae]
MTRRLRATATAPALLLALALSAGCSADEATPRASGTPTPGAGVDTSDAAAERFAALPVDSIEAAVVGDMARVRTVQAHVVGTHQGFDVVADVAVDDAADCVGTLQIGEGTVELLRVAGQVHASFDRELLEALGHSPIAAEGIVERVADRWVLLDPASGLTDVAIACQATLEAIGGSVFGDDLADLSVDGLEEIDDRTVLALSRESDQGPTRVWVEAAGSHRYVRVEAPRDGQAYVVDQIVYDGDVEVPDPAARGVVDAAAVGLS